VQNQWYKKTEAEICAFFDVHPARGLTKKDVLARLVRFGSNRDARLPEALCRTLRVTVMREAKKQLIAFEQLVPGDVVVLQEGCRVPADIRLLQVNKLFVNQSSLTGEALSVPKNTFTISGEAVPSKQKCMAFAGSYVEGGSGVGIVVERGAQTVLARASKKRTGSAGIKGSVIARRLKRYGVIVLQKRALGVYRKIDTAIIAAECDDAAIIELVRKVQLMRNIDCKFAVATSVATRLSKEFGAEVFDAHAKTGNIEQAQFITNLDTNNSLELALLLRKKDRTSLWVSDGTIRLRAFSAAPVTLVIGDAGRDDVILAADVYAPKASTAILARILYNKK